MALHDDSAHAADGSLPHDLPTSDALLQIADGCFGQGFVALAEHLATLATGHGATDEQAGEARRRSTEARAVDAAAMRCGLRDDEFLIPSIERRHDGSPAFLLPIPAVTAGQAEVLQVIAQELQGEGVDAELRVFLGVMLEADDAFIDCDPGFGLASLSAATRHPGRITVVSRAADDDHAAFLRRAFAANGLHHVAVDGPVHSDPQPVGAMLRNPLLAHAGRIIVHAGVADDISVTLADIAPALHDARVAAIVWSIGSDEATAVVADALASLGAEHFVVASDAEGAMLVPQDAVSGATLIVSLTARAFAERQAA